MKIGLIGFGNIGRAIYSELINSASYKDVYVADQSKIDNIKNFTQLNIYNTEILKDWIRDKSAIICATPYVVVKTIAKAVAECGVPYFDLTEDRATTDYIKSLKSDSVLVPQCGLAPGVISIIANGLMQQFTSIHSAELRVGALPKYPNNEMKYNLTWSTDGLINEYCNMCEALIGGKQAQVQPLEGYETIDINGKQYEAFNTSGGLGTMCETYAGKVRTLNYKTIRYMGHQHLMKFLLHDLKMSREKAYFTDIFNKYVAKTKDDVVIIMVKVTGIKNNQLQEINYYKRIPCTQDMSAIQLTTTSGVLGVVDSWFSFNDNWTKKSGFVKQEEVPNFYSTIWGRLYQ